MFPVQNLFFFIIRLFIPITRQNGCLIILIMQNVVIIMQIMMIIIIKKQVMMLMGRMLTSAL